jgi:hypothetical protein
MSFLRSFRRVTSAMIRAQYAVTRTVPTLPTAPRGVLSPVTSTSASLCGQGATYVVYKNINLMHQMVRVCVLKLAFCCFSCVA